MIRQLAAEALAAMSPQPGEAPQLPTVGRIVHFHNTAWTPEGPYAAIVTGVQIVSESDKEIQAKIDLTVFGNDPHQAMKIYKDVSVGPPDGAHLPFWWTWPPRS